MKAPQPVIFMLAAVMVLGVTAPRAGCQSTPAVRGSAREGTPVPTPKGTSNAQVAPEEPDFAFIAGGPYTQPKGSFQLVMPGWWSVRHSTAGGMTTGHSEFGALFRNEWGLTDRWELDLITQAEGERDSLNGARQNSTFAVADSTLGIRYRLLREPSFPLTLTMGPQIILPTGSVASGTGFGRAGYAWDVSTARDWGGLFFIYNSFNYAWFPGAADPASRRTFNLSTMAYGSALGMRPLEKDAGADTHHDIHTFLEFGWARAETIQNSLAGPSKGAEVQMVLAPGIRYGLMRRYSDGKEKNLYEVGVSFPLGLNSMTPRMGVILQIQIEHVFE